MSHHHHHPHEGHSHGNSPKSKPVHQDWRYYAAAILILVAMAAYLLSGDLRERPAPLPQPAATTTP